MNEFKDYIPEPPALSEEEKLHIGPEPPAPPPGPPGPHEPPAPPPGPHGPHKHPAPPPPPPRPGIFGTERYEGLGVDEKIAVLLSELGHMQRLGPDGRGGQMRALAILRKEGTMTQRELTERLGIRPASASELLGKLENAGLISRSPDISDRRTMDIRITEAGMERAGNGEDEKNPVAVLTEEEKETVLALLEKIAAGTRP